MKRLVIDTSVLAEVERALRKPYFRELIEDEEIAEAVSIIRDAGTMLDDPADPPAVLRDPTDDYHEGLSPPAIASRTACKLLAMVD